MEKEQMRKLQEERQDRLNRTKARIRTYFKENPEKEICYQEYTAWYLCRHCDEVVTSEHFDSVCGHYCIHSCIFMSVEPCQHCTYTALADPVCDPIDFMDSILRNPWDPDSMDPRDIWWISSF